MFKNVISYRVPFVFVAGVFIIYQLVIREGICLLYTSNKIISPDFKSFDYTL